MKFQDLKGVNEIKIETITIDGDLDPQTSTATVLIDTPAQRHHLEIVTAVVDVMIIDQGGRRHLVVIDEIDPQIVMITDGEVDLIHRMAVIVTGTKIRRIVSLCQEEHPMRCLKYRF